MSGLKTYFKIKKKVFKAVDGLDFEVKKGDTLAIVGESGSGKSITSLSVMGLIPKPNGQIVEGEIVFNGQDLTKLSHKEMSNIRGNKISMIFQEPMTSLNPVLRIGDQIEEALFKHLKLSKEEAKKRSIAMLQKVGFSKPEMIYQDFPHKLSGGMRQRVMIAMAMACEPELLIADEPTTALDVTIQAQVLELMKKMKQEFGSTIILITHDLGVVAEMADRVLVMYAGQVVESADARSIFTNPQHPYTHALLASIPRLQDDKERLHSIPGNVPPSDAFPEGCRFADRCGKAVASCRTKAPEYRELSTGHWVRCDLV